MNTKTVPERLFFCIAGEVTQAEIPVLAGQAVGPLHEALAKENLVREGDLHFICPEWKGADAKNKLLLAIPIAKEAEVASPYFLFKAPSFKCIWRDHQGPMTTIKAAWDSLVTDAETEGLRPVGSWREVYKHWESFDSPNNLTELQMEIQ